MILILPDKVRAALKPMTFEISPDREVTLATEYIDTKTERQERIQREKDETIIECVTEAIKTQKVCESPTMSCDTIGSSV